MFWLILTIVVCCIAFIIGNYFEMRPMGGYYVLISFLLCGLVCSLFHVYMKPEFSAENIRLVDNDVIRLDEHFHKKDIEGNIRVLIPVSVNKGTRDYEFVITSDLPEFEEIFNGKRKSCYVIKSDKYKDVVLQVYKFKSSFFCIGDLVDPIYILAIPENHVYEAE